jgi:hypothetical protein
MEFESNFTEILTPHLEKIRADLKLKSNKRDIMEEMNRMQEKFQINVEKMSNATMIARQAMKKEVTDKASQRQVD